MITERDIELGREACAALARATWFAEYLERKFALVRAEERARCAAIARSIWRPTWRGDPPATVVEVGQAIAKAIERGEG